MELRGCGQGSERRLVCRRRQVGGEAGLRRRLTGVSQGELRRDGRLGSAQGKVSAGGRMAVLVPGEVSSYRGERHTGSDRNTFIQTDATQEPVRGTH